MIFMEVLSRHYQELMYLEAYKNTLQLSDLEGIAYSHNSRYRKLKVFSFLLN